MFVFVFLWLGRRTAKCCCANEFLLGGGALFARSSGSHVRLWLTVIFPSLSLIFFFFLSLSLSLLAFFLHDVLCWRRQGESDFDCSNGGSACAFFCCVCVCACVCVLSPSPTICVIYNETKRKFAFFGESDL